LRPWFPDLDLGTIRIVERGPVCWYVRNVVRQGAMTVAPYVFYGRERLDPEDPGSLALLAHELNHVRQYKRFGHARLPGATSAIWPATLPLRPPEAAARG
jgi:hypothetical protein